MTEEEYGYEIDWGCIGDLDEESGTDPEWDFDENQECWECHSCDNGPCFQ